MLNDRLIKWLSREQPGKSSGNTARRSVVLSTDIGLIRKQNQDRVACMKVSGRANDAKPFAVIALSDGMGGMSNGAECAVRTIAGFFDSIVRNRNLDELGRMSIAAENANDEVYSYSGGYGGATLSALLVSEVGAVIVNVGDSRVYAEIKAGSSRLKRLTVDDSLAEIVGGNGRELLQFIGMGEGLKVKVSPVVDKAVKIILTSDGIHFINQDALEMIFSNAPDLGAAANRISTLARWSGAPDNATLAVLSLSDLQDSLTEETDAGIEFWDPFGDFYFSFGRDENKPSPDYSGVARVSNKPGDNYKHAGAKRNSSSPSESEIPSLKNLSEESSSASEGLKKIDDARSSRLDEIKSEISRIQGEINNSVAPNKSAEVEGQVFDDENLVKRKSSSSTKRIVRSRKKTPAKNKKDSENFQIVIEMDSENREESDESSGKV